MTSEFTGFGLQARPWEAARRVLVGFGELPKQFDELVGRNFASGKWNRACKRCDLLMLCAPQSHCLCSSL